MYVRQRGKSWKVECRVTAPGGFVHEANSTFDTKAAATSWGKAKDAEFRTMAGGGFPPCTVRELLARWRKEVAPGRDGARWDINRLLAIERRMEGLGFVDLPLASFTNRQMSPVRRARLADGISPASVKREEALLGAVWKAARHPDWGLTDVDPFKDLGGIKGSRGQPRNRKAQWPEIRRILRQMDYHPRGAVVTMTQQTALAVLLALRTTLRSQEVLQLADSAVDLRRMVITIPQHKTLYRTERPKSVPLMPKALVLMARKCLGRGQFFTLKAGSRDALFRKNKKLAGVPDLTFHDLKRTAVLLLKVSLSEDELMAVTGNADVETLRRHYMTDTAAEASKIVWRTLGLDPRAVLASLGVASSTGTPSPAPDPTAAASG
jgi:integrase